jgi:glycosyltransferase involved in cell wall biosynthesis
VNTVAKAPIISIVVAVRNGEESLERCLTSVMDQDYPRVDLVVIDGASTDGSVEIIERHAERIGTWLSESDDGVYDAWNKAIDRASGEWLCFLGADDKLASSQVLSRVATSLASRPERVVYGKVQAVDASGGVRMVLGEPWTRAKAAFAGRMSIPNPATFYHRSLFDSHGRFDDRYRIAGDYEFLLRELVTNDAWFVDEVVTVMGMDGMSFLAVNRPRSLREAARARRRHGILVPPDWRSLEIYEAYGYAWLARLLGPDRSGRMWDAYRAKLRR